VTAILDDPAYARAAADLQAEIAAMPSPADVLDVLVDLARSQRRSA
jgi:hypothetical protein